MDTHPQPPPLDPPLPEKLDAKILFEALLRRPRNLIIRLTQPGHGATWRFTVIALFSFLLFGVVLGCFSKHDQLWAAPLKISAGLLIAGAICFPSLYIFSTLAGAKLSAQHLAATFTGALALAGLLLLGFAPALWIFAESTDSFGFMGALGIGAWLISLCFGLRFLKISVLLAGATQRAPMFIWSMIFSLVTLQMTTSLRPILGTSPQILTQEKKFFLSHWGEWFARTQSPAATQPEQSHSTGERNPSTGRKDATSDSQ